MPRRRTETIGAGNQEWLGSSHGIWNGRTIPLKRASFTATNGYIPSGTPIAVDTTDNSGVPYNAAGTGDVTKLAGFLLTDQSVAGITDTYVNAPLLDHGRVIKSKVPGGSFAAPAAANNLTTIVFE